MQDLFSPLSNSLISFKTFCTRCYNCKQIILANQSIFSYVCVTVGKVLALVPLSASGSSAHKTLVIQRFFGSWVSSTKKPFPFQYNSAFIWTVSVHVAQPFCTMIHYAILLLDMLNHGMTVCQLLCMPTITCSCFKDREGCRNHYSAGSPNIWLREVLSRF